MCVCAHLAQENGAHSKSIFTDHVMLHQDKEKESLEEADIDLSETVYPKREPPDLVGVTFPFKTMQCLFQETIYVCKLYHFLPTLANDSLLLF